MGGSVGSVITQIATIAVIGAVAVYGTPMLAGALGITSAFGVGMVTMGLVTATSYVLGKAMGQPNPSNLESSMSMGNYATTSLQNNTNNNNTVPIIYGETRRGGDIIFRALSDSSDSHLYSIVSLASHELEAILSLKANNEDMTLENLDQFRAIGDKVLVKAYKVKPATPIKCLTGVGAEADLSSLVSGWSDDKLPADASFLVVHQIYDATNHNQPAVITSVVKGKKVQVFSNGALTVDKFYSNNPVDIILNLLLEPLAFNESLDNIDLVSFLNAHTTCIDNGFTCNLNLNSTSTLIAILDEVKGAGRLNIIYNYGKWELVADKYQRYNEPDYVVERIDPSKILIDSLVLNMKKTSDLANKITLVYIEPADEWQTKEVSYQDDALILSDGGVYEKKIRMRAITNITQAQKLCELMLNQLRYSEDINGNRLTNTPIAITFDTTITLASIKIGDIVDLEHFILPDSISATPYYRKFIVIGKEIKQDGKLSFMLNETCDTHYKKTDNTTRII